MDTPTPISAVDRQRFNVSPIRFNNNIPEALDRGRHEPTDEDARSIMQEDRESVNPESTTLDSITPESVTIVDDQMPTLKTGAKRSLPTATKDEWSDSSDDEVNQSVDGNGNGTSNVDQTFTSEYFRFNASEKAGESSSSKRPKIVANPRGGDRVTAKQPAAKALSMSIRATDHRERRAVEKELKEKVCASIDEDILQQVDAEGGITPGGRLYKAVYLMMRRTQGQCQQTITPPRSSPEISDELAELRVENQMLRQRIEDAAKLLGSE